LSLFTFGGKWHRSYGLPPYFTWNLVEDFAGEGDRRLHVPFSAKGQNLLEFRHWLIDTTQWCRPTALP